MPVSTQRAPEADSTSPSFNGVSSPEDNAKASPTTTTKKPTEISAFFNFCVSPKRFRREKIKVAAIDTKK